MRKSYKMTMKVLVASFFLTFNIAEAQLTVIAEGDVYSVGGVSDNGVVSLQINVGGKTFIWTASGGLVQIGALAPGIQVVGRTPISSDGTLVTSGFTNTATGTREISTYNIATSTWTNRGALAAIGSGGGESFPWGISPDGNTIVGLGFLTGGLAHAVKWTQDSGVVDLGSMVSGQNSRANAVNGDGNVIVGWQDLQGKPARGAKWVNGVETLITDNNGINVGEAGGVSADGNIIIGANLPSPYVWDAATGLTFITHPNASVNFRGGATGISADGKKVIGFYRPFSSPALAGEGFIWTKTDGRINLNNYATSLGIATNGITMSLPTAISQDGMKIAGVGLNASNIPIAFYLDLTQYLSVNDTAKDKNDIAVYPNPVSDILYFKGNIKIEKAEIYNMVGQKVKSFDSVNDQINVASLSKGDYILQYSVKGKGPQTYKFIKK